MRLIVRGLHDKRPQALQKLVVNSALKNLDEHRADIKAANALLLKELYAVLGEVNARPRILHSCTLIRRRKSFANRFCHAVRCIKDTPTVHPALGHVFYYQHFIMY